MCYPLPGPRCSSYASKGYIVALKKWQTNPSFESQKALREAEKIYDMTPKGQEELRILISELGDDDGVYSARLEWGINARKAALEDLKMADRGDIDEHSESDEPQEKSNATTPNDVARHIAEKNPGIILQVGKSGDVVVVHLIAVKKEYPRGTGLAGKAMKDLCSEADKRGWVMALTPSSDFGSAKTRLTRWYSSLGFVPNSGRAKDYSTRETMIRRPVM